MKHLSLFLWLIVPVGLWLVIALFGTPHLVVSYRFQDNGRIYDPFAPRIYTSCDYLGVNGWVTVHARHGKCPWLRLFKAGA